MRFDFDKCIKDGVEQAMKECELTIGMTLKEAVERQIPKEPYTMWDCPKDNHYCPQCARLIFLNGQKYCTECGQALDWSDTK